jgi:hypothetical protein
LVGISKSGEMKNDLAGEFIESRFERRVVENIITGIQRKIGKTILRIKLDEAGTDETGESGTENKSPFNSPFDERGNIVFR